MKITLRILCLCLVLALTACTALAEGYDFSASGLTAAGSAQQLGAPDDYGAQTVRVRLPGENPAQDGVNPITGESFSGAYRPTLVNIDTHPRALPHWGVSSADLMYELPIQADGSTRSVAVFMGKYPDSAGPVRSARIPMASLREMWGGTYCFFGYQEGSTNVKEWVLQNGAEKRFAYPYYLNGITKNSGWFPRSSDHSHVAPYNVRLDLTKVLKDYSLTPAPHPFLFTETGLARGEDVSGLIISYKETSPAYVTAYQYNEATGLYDRYRNGSPYIDANNGEACAYANVIVLRTDVSWMNGNTARPVIRLHGEGVCEVFQNGKYIRGTWARDCTATDDLQNRMVFLDENGEEIAMKVGKTFIQIVDNEQPVVVISEENIVGSVAPQEQRLTIGELSTSKRTPKATRTPKPTRTPEPTATPQPTEQPTQAPTAEPTEQPEADESQPEQTPDSDESQPEQKPDSDESQPEQTPDSDESQPEQTPDSDESQPEQKPDSDESQPEQTPDSDESQPEQKPDSDESQPEQTPDSDESQPEQDTATPGEASA